MNVAIGPRPKNMGRGAARLGSLHHWYGLDMTAVGDFVGHVHDDLLTDLDPIADAHHAAFGGCNLHGAELYHVLVIGHGHILFVVAQDESVHRFHWRGISSVCVKTVAATPQRGTLCR